MSYVARLLCPIGRAVHGIRRTLGKNLRVGELIRMTAPPPLVTHLMDTLPGIDPDTHIIRHEVVASRGVRGVDVTAGWGDGIETDHFVAIDEEGFTLVEIDGDFRVDCPPHHVCAVSEPAIGFVCPPNTSDDYIHVHCHVVTSTRLPENLSGAELVKPDNEQLVFEYLPPYAIPHL